METNKIIQGDVIEVLKTLPSDSCETVITSPPYAGLRDYGVSGQIGLEPTIKEYIDKILEVTQEVKRVMKPTGTFYLNHGNSYVSSGKQRFDKTKYGGLTKIHCGRTQTNEFPATCLSMQNYRLVLKMIDLQGWILRDIIIWEKVNCMPSSVKSRRNFVYEPIFMFVKSNKTNYYYNSKTGLMADRKPTKLVEGIDWDWEIKEETIYSEPVSKYAKGSDFEKKYGEPWDRFGDKTKKAQVTKIPAEMAEQSGSPSARIYRKENKEKISYWHGLTYWFDLEAIRVPHKESTIKRAEYPMNPYGDQETGSGAMMVGSVKGKGVRKIISLPEGGKNPGNIMSIPTRGFKGAHFATFSPELIRPLILSSCPKEVCSVCGKPRVRILRPSAEYAKLLGKDWNDTPYEERLEKGHHTKNSKVSTFANYETVGWSDCSCLVKEGNKYRPGIVLDCFMGSGSTGIAAKQLGRDYLGIEISPEYIKMAEERLKNEPKPIL